MKILTVLMLATTLAGCAQAGVKITETVTRANGEVVTTVTAPASEYGDQLEAAVVAMNRQRQPLFKLTAKPGEDMALKGVASLEVYSEEKPVALPAAPPSAAAAIVHDVVGGVVTLGTYGIAGSVAKGIAGSIERAGTAGYPFVQAPVAPAPPTANITNNIGGDAVQGDGSTLNSVGGTGAAGGNYADQHSPVDSSNQGNTDNSNQGNGNPDNSNQGNGNPVTGNPAPAAP